MTIAFLDTAAMGSDFDLSPLAALGEVRRYDTTAPHEMAAHTAGAEVLILNKVRVNADTLPLPTTVRLICVAATGYDNVDVAFCRQHGIAVCNVVGYSTDSVVQVTAAMALSLVQRLPAFCNYVRSGRYSADGVATHLEPTFHEIAGKTWGIVGCGSIGTRVAQVAEALGCRVITHQRHPHPTYPTVPPDTLCAEADILSLHVPLNDQTRGWLNRERIALMKPTAIVINVARGAVTDEQALAEAVVAGKLGGIGVDVYSREPFAADHPFYALRERDNVCLTPHMAWGAWEARCRCLEEIIENIRAFCRGERRCRVD